MDRIIKEITNTMPLIRRIRLTIAGIIAIVFVVAVAGICTDGPEVLLNERRVVVKSDGKMSTFIHRRVKSGAASEIARVNRVELSYDSSTDEARWVSVRRMTAKGSEFAPGEDLTGKMPSLAPDAGTAGGVVCMEIRLPLKGGGDVIDYEIEVLKKRPLMGPNFWNIHVFSGDVPVKESVFSVTFPADRKLFYQSQGATAEPVIEKKDKDVTYRWTMRDVSAPADEKAAPYVAVSTTPDWADLFSWLNMVYESSIETDIPMREYANGVYFKFEHNKIEVLRQFYQRASAGISPVPLAYERRALPPNKATDVNRRGAGDCKDKVVLLAALLRQAQIEAYPALLNTGFTGDIESQLPHPYYFNHAIVYIPKQMNFDHELWLDPTNAGSEWYLLPPEDQGKQALILMNEKTRFARIGN